MYIYFFNRSALCIPIFMGGLDIFFTSMFESVLSFCMICTGGLLIQTRLKNKQVIRSINAGLSSLTDENKERAKQINFIQHFIFSYVMNGPNMTSTTHIHQIIQDTLRMKESHLTNKKMIFRVHQTSLTTSFVANNSCWFIFIHEIFDLFIHEYPPETTITYQLLAPSGQKNLPFFQLIFTDDLPIPSFAFKKMSKLNTEDDAYYPYALKALLEKLGLFIHISFSIHKGNKLVIVIPLDTSTSRDTHSNVIPFDRSD